MAKKKAAKKKAAGAKKSVETITHADDKRSNIPTAEMASVVSKADKAPVKLRYPRNTDLDPQLVWKGKDEQDESDLVVNAPPLYIQEKVHPKVLIDAVRRNVTMAQPDEAEALVQRMAALHARLARTNLDQLKAGEIAA